MKLLFDFLPIVLFFAAFKFYDIYVATAVIIVSTFAQAAYAKWKYGKVDKILWISLGLVVVFGGATLILHNEEFIKWKLTIFYWVFALVLLGASVLLKKNLIRSLLASQAKLELPEHIWRILNQMWIAFFAVVGGLNLYIFQHYSTETWVNFKLFGTLGLMLLFMVAQGILIAKHIKE